MSKKQEREQSNQAKNKKLLTIVLVVAIVLTVDLTITGFLKFGYYAVRCGGVPVLIQPGCFAGRASYILPGKYIPGWADSAYVCTEEDAIGRGIMKNPYEN